MAMLCTRWILPLLLLPLPTAPSFFLLIFLVSITLHARPCFYCVVLLTTLFVSSCYWQALPIETSLSIPWSENITTYAEALNSTLSPMYLGRPLPCVIRPMDRCWCDFNGDSIFAPYNVSRWETLSVIRLKLELERQWAKEDLKTVKHDRVSPTETTSAESIISEMPRTAPPAQSTILYLWAKIKSIPDSLRSFRSSEEEFIEPEDVAEENTTETRPLPWLRMEYDFTTYGLNTIIDFNWLPKEM